MFRSLTMIALGVMLLACTQQAAQNPQDQSIAPEIEYHQDSWRTLIPRSCTRFFDGCNHCTRAPGADMAACTRMACVKYKKPVCLDDQLQSGAVGH